MGDETRYRPDEAARILERAAALSRSTPARGDAYRGVTLRDLEARAAELGIDAEAVRRAAVELAAPGAREGGFRLLPPRRIHLSASTSNPIAIEHSEPFVRLLRPITKRLGDAGAAHVEGRSLTWTSTMLAGRRVEVELHASHEGTSIDVREDLDPIIGGVVGGIIGGMGGGLGGAIAGIVGGALKDPPLGVALMMLTVLASLVLARWALEAVARRRREELALVRGDLVDAVASYRTPSTPTRDAEPEVDVAAEAKAEAEALAEAEAEADQPTSRARAAKS